MKATETKLLIFLNKSPQFVIPIYQRTYSWTEKECCQLWDDIIRAGKDEAISVHFVGSIVYIEDGLSNNTLQSPQLVIDGQQRLTTVTLLIAALAKVLEKVLGGDELMPGFSAQRLRNNYLLDPEETDERRYKLLLSQTDKASLTAIVDENEQPQNHSIRVKQNFELFEELITKYKDKDNLRIICKGLVKLAVVDIALNREHDNPQLIFESMNSTGRKLSQADLIRNFVLMGLESALQTRLYEQFWRPMERAFGQKAYDTHFDGFMRYYLIVKTGDIPRLDGVYEAFKTHARNIGATDSDVEPLVKEIRDYASYFCAMALGEESDQDLKVSFHDLRELKVDVAYPFLLELYHDYTTEILKKDEFTEVIRLIEAYVFRRAICTIPTNSMNKTFATFSKALKKDCYLESIKAHFLTLPSYRRFPKDEEFERDIQKRDLFNFRSKSYWLRRLENFERRERALIEDYTIEHIMPQNKNLSLAWQNALGPEWKSIQETWLHTLGNLTLTGYNSEYSDKPFVTKRDMRGGFKESPLKVNAGLGTLNEWNEEAIKNRAAQLAEKALNVWPAPELATDILDAYRQETVARDNYSIEDHPHLISNPMHNLFVALRKEVMMLDPCVSEEFLKPYVAYKAETNFVDIVPQARQLRIYLNMRFIDISDPRSLCDDVSNLGHLGNGDVRFDISEHTEIPYVIGLIRQSLEIQLGNEEVT